MYRRKTEQNAQRLHDYGPRPFVFNIDRLSEYNKNYRTAIWTGDHLQVTLMSIPVGGDIGLEIHPDTDQFIRIESGRGLAEMGNAANKLSQRKQVGGNDAVIVPAGTWHNITNIGRVPLKLYSVYAPPKHPYGTIHETKEIAEAEEN
ncbi:MAG: cupin domain-containing protein [Eubacteriales bacterium]